MRQSRSTLLGVPITDRTLAALTEAGRQAIQNHGGPFVVACANPHSLVTAQFDTQFRAALNTAGAVIADGVGVSVAVRLARFHARPRITGTDFFLSLMRSLNETGGKVFFFGSTDAVLERVRRRAAQDFPRVVVDTLSPPFGDWGEEQNRLMLERISVRKPDVLWVAMTAPKQEKWVAKYANALYVPVIGSIGAVFEYYATTTHRAPQWICDIGFEWLYRLAREPRRLWRRTVISAPLFIWFVLKESLGLRATHSNS